MVTSSTTTTPMGTCSDCSAVPNPLLMQGTCLSRDIHNQGTNHKLHWMTVPTLPEWMCTPAGVLHGFLHNMSPMSFMARSSCPPWWLAPSPAIPQIPNPYCYDNEDVRPLQEWHQTIKGNTIPHPQCFNWTHHLTIDTTPTSWRLCRHNSSYTDAYVLC